MMKNNPEADRKLRDAAVKLDLIDAEAAAKEKAYQEEEKSLWRRIMRKVRPMHGEWTRQDSLYNITNNPELALPLKAFESIDDPIKTAQILAQEELKAQGLEGRIAEQARPILEQIGQESYLNYTQYDPNKDEEYFQFYLLGKQKKFKKEQLRAPFSFEQSTMERNSRAEWAQMNVDQKMPTVREWAIENASAAGIKHAPELVSAILGEVRDPRELMANLSLDDLIDQVKRNLPAMMATQPFDREAIRSQVLALASDRSNWLDPEEVAIIEKILEQKAHKGKDHQKSVQALMVVGMGIHISWSAFQGPRSVVDQKELFDQAQVDKTEMMGRDFVRRYEKLRVIKPINRPFAMMQINKFKEGYGYDNNNDKGMSMAIFEILKDLINIGLPEEQSNN